MTKQATESEGRNVITQLNNGVSLEQHHLVEQEVHLLRGIFENVSVKFLSFHISQVITN